LKTSTEYGFAAFQSTATRESRGRISFSNSSRFAPRSGAIPDLRAAFQAPLYAAGSKAWHGCG
jgi:hypothetical protein